MVCHMAQAVFFVRCTWLKLCVSRLSCSGFRLLEFSLRRVLFRPGCLVFHLWVDILCWCPPCRRHRFTLPAFDRPCPSSVLCSVFVASAFLLSASVSSDPLTVPPSVSFAFNGGGVERVLRNTFPTRRSVQSLWCMFLFFQTSAILARVLSFGKFPHPPAP